MPPMLTAYLADEKFGLIHPEQRTPLTWQGRIIFHSSQGELAWLYPDLSVQKLTASDAQHPLVWVGELPKNQGLRWPLRKSDFLPWEGQGEKGTPIH